MTAGAFARATGSYVPGPALIIFGYWVSAFSALGLSNPLWERNMGRLGIGLGTFFSVVIRQVSSGKADSWYRISTIIAAGVFAMLIVTCFGMNTILGHRYDPSGYINDVWRFAFVAAMTDLCVTLTFASMIGEVSSWLFWACIAVFS
jgi:hypothetical protein